MKIEFDQYDIGPHVQKRPRIISLPPLEALRSKTSIDLWNSSYDDIAYFEQRKHDHKVEKPADLKVLMQAALKDRFSNQKAQSKKITKISSRKIFKKETHKQIKKSIIKEEEGDNEDDIYLQKQKYIDIDDVLLEDHFKRICEEKSTVGLKIV